VRALALLGWVGVALILCFAQHSGVGAQEPQLTLSPASGPCDAAIRVAGQGYAPAAEVTISVARPHSEGAYASLSRATADETGTFSVEVTLGEVGCEVAALDLDQDSPGEPRDLVIIAAGSPAATGSSAAFYEYTTTSIGGSEPTATVEAAAASPTAPVPTVPGDGGSGEPNDDDGGVRWWIAAALVVGVVAVGASWVAWRRSRR
jgi:hypothetical protein